MIKRLNLRESLFLFNVYKLSKEETLLQDLLEYKLSLVVHTAKSFTFKSPKLLDGKTVTSKHDRVEDGVIDDFTNADYEHFSARWETSKAT